MNLDDLIAAERRAPAEATEEQTREVWNAVEHSFVPLTPPPGLPTTGPEASALTKIGAALSTGVGKAVVAVSVVAGGAAVVVTDHGEAEPTPAAVAPRATPSPTPAPVRVQEPAATAEAPSLSPSAVPAAAQPTPARAATARRPKRASVKADARATGESSISAELALIRTAQSALRDGKPRQALRHLDEHAQTHPKGAFIEDREALRVLAGCELPGTAASARTAAADRFRKRWPAPVFLGRIDTACK